eukprot:733349_1
MAYVNSGSPFPALRLNGDMIRDYDSSYQSQKDTYIEKSNDGIPVYKDIGTLNEEYSQSHEECSSFDSPPPLFILHHRSLSDSTSVGDDRFSFLNMELHYERGGQSDTPLHCESPSKSKSETPTSFLELDDSMSDGYKPESVKTLFSFGQSHIADASNRCPPLSVLREVTSPYLSASNDPVTITAEYPPPSPDDTNASLVGGTTVSPVITDHPNSYQKTTTVHLDDRRLVDSYLHQVYREAKREFGRHDELVAMIQKNFGGPEAVENDPKTQNQFESREFGDSSNNSAIITAPSEARKPELSALVLDDKTCIDIDNNTKAVTALKTRQHTGTATNVRVRSANNTSSIFAFVILLGLVALYSTKTDGRASMMSISGSSWRGHSAKHPGDHPSSSSGGLWGRASTILLVVAISVGATGLTGAVVWWWYRAHFPHTTPSTQEMLEKYYL